MNDLPTLWTAQSAMSDPGSHGHRLDALADDAVGLCRVVQGLLLHDYAGGLYYGAAPATFFEQSRATLPVAQRLDAVLARDDAPLDGERAPFAREVGTCRDFALLLCSLMRHKGRPARVRCGFAAYFGADGWEDHWVCEHWLSNERRWARADAQLDAAHRQHLNLDFDVTDLPAEVFTVAPDAWLRYRDGADPGRWGHGDATGAWFLEVNLARDILALGDTVTSDWDRWREAPAPCREPDPDRLARCDGLAQEARILMGHRPDGLPARVPLPDPGMPPWFS